LLGSTPIRDAIPRIQAGQINKGCATGAVFWSDLRLTHYDIVRSRLGCDPLFGHTVGPYGSPNPANGVPIGSETARTVIKR